jgi:hypothetical protein
MHGAAGCIAADVAGVRPDDDEASAVEGRDRLLVLAACRDSIDQEFRSPGPPSAVMICACTASPEVSPPWWLVSVQVTMTRLLTSGPSLSVAIAGSNWSAAFCVLTRNS